MIRDCLQQISFVFIAGILLGSFVNASEQCKNEIASVSEETEIELKFLVPRLALFPSDILSALKAGAPHEKILRRGIVVQEYLDVNSENLSEFVRLMSEAHIPFGSLEKQNEFLRTNKAKEIRMMSKSIKIGDKKVEFYQATIKGGGGLSVQQLESPENISEEQMLKIKHIFSSLRPKVKHRINKIYFEILATDSNGNTLLRKTGEPYSVEVDLILGRSGIKEAPVLINSEVEFHGSDAELEGEKWRNNLENRPPYFGLDLTDAAGVKSRDISTIGFAPESIRQILAPHSKENHEIARFIWNDFIKWADLEIVSLNPSED